MAAEPSDGPKRRRAAPQRTVQGIGPASAGSAIPPSAVDAPSPVGADPVDAGPVDAASPVDAGLVHADPVDAADAADARPRRARDLAPTDLGFVPPPEAPKVEIDPTLERDAAAARAVPASPPKGRKPAAPTELMADVQERRKRQARESSDLPLKLGLSVVAVLIAGLVTALAYLLMRP